MRTISYIDGFNLYWGLKSKKLQKYYWLDVCKLSELLTPRGEDLLEANYFTARISSPNSKRKRQNTYLEALATLKRCKMHFGHYLKDKKTCAHCGKVDYVPSEKMTDVNIAVRLMADAYQNRFDTAIIISGDSDLAPPITEILERFPDKRIIVAFPPERVSNHLKKVASSSKHIWASGLSKCQLPNEVLKENGFVLKRPERWAEKILVPVPV